VVHGFSLSPSFFLPSPYTTPSPFDGKIRIEGILLHPNPLGVLERKDRERVETLASVKRGMRWRVMRSAARGRGWGSRGARGMPGRVSKRTATRMRPRTARHMAQQVGQELDHLGAPNRAGKQMKVKIPTGHARHRRQRLPVEINIATQASAPSAHMCDSGAASGSVRFRRRRRSCAARLGLFLISGHRFCFQHWIAASSLSRARPVGRWQLHPICRRMRQACSEWYCTPHSVSIK
jgi:hypothetical protein